MANWYGIPGLEFKWHGEWSDPGVIYKGVEINSTIPEDTMWERFREETNSTDTKAFARYMKANASDVKELVCLAMQPIASKCVCNWGGIVILATDGYTVVSAENYGDGCTGISKATIRYNMKGEPFFMRHGRREYFKDYLKTDL